MKRNTGSALAIAVTLALGATVSAQNVPAQFVVSGKAAEQIQDFTTINLATAERIAETCEKLAAAGVKIPRPAGPMAHGGSVIAFIEDPDGYRIELVQRS